MRRTSNLRRYGLGPALALVALVACASSASAATKDYSLVIAPATVAPGVAEDMTATFTNLTKVQELGSANLTPPPGYALVSVEPLAAPATANIVNGVVELRNLSLQPGSAFTVSLSVTTACVSGTVASNWSALTKQANDFKGTPGNGLTLDPEQSAITTTTIGACVPCPEDTSCPPASFQQEGSSLSLVANPNPNPFVLDAGKLKASPLLPEQLDCAGWEELVSTGYTFDGPPNRQKVTTMKYPGTAKNVPLQACYGAPVASGPFAVKNGFARTEETIGGVTTYVGILPNCSGSTPAPCVSDRNANARSITVVSPNGDPQRR